MPDKGLHVQQNENVDRGRLQVNVTSTLGLQPVVNARVGIAYTGESQRLLEELETDSSGQTEARSSVKLHPVLCLSVFHVVPIAVIQLYQSV